MLPALRAISGRVRCAAVLAACCLALLSCGTGIEITERVTDKDVNRVIDEVNSRQAPVTVDAYVDSLPAWQPGKRFWVADNQIRLLFSHSQNDGTDTVSLAGRVLKYVGYETGSIYDNRSTVNIIFKDAETGKTYVYRTDKTISDFRPGFSIPMLIDLDMVNHIARQVAGNDYFIKTPIWYDRLTEQMRDGRHFIKVHVDSVMPGNAVMPLRVLFTTIDTGERALVWMSVNSSAMRGRDFDALFTASDPHLGFPLIGDVNWLHITRGEVVVGMTKEECRLALGSPKRINENPDQGGMREYWYYDGGSYLYFVDGLLNQFRR